MMRLKDIPLKLTRSAFAEAFPDARVNAQGKASFSEPVTGGTVVYSLQFKGEALEELILYVNEDFNEESHQNLLALAREVMEIVGTRGLGVAAEQTQPLAWKDLIESPLPETGDRSISVLRAAWKTNAAKAVFSYAWTWPGQLILEYRETLIS